MQRISQNRGGVRVDGALRGASLRFLTAAATALTVCGAVVGGASADDPSGPITTGASNGGIASASSGGEIHIGTIVTGENTGNSISTGNIAGSAELHGGEIDYPTNVNVYQNDAPLIATADGGDYGNASPPEGDGPEVDIDINNEDRNRNDNRSDATGIGEGGEGGEGGDGGDVIINPGGEPVE
jgi:hypothetical protein